MWGFKSCIADIRIKTQISIGRYRENGYNSTVSLPEQSSTASDMTQTELSKTGREI